jgi:galactitol 2-dehydrogenase
MRLEGKSVLITGAVRDIGRAFADRYIREGTRIAIADIILEAARKTGR